MVDNNSTDGTVAVAQRYSFVTILHEPRQGVAYARDRGFNAATGDIIGRTDGDTVLAPNWVAQTQVVFSDPTIDAASGIVYYRDIGLQKAFDVIDTALRSWLARRMAPRREVFLYGVTMGIRRSAWEKVREHICHQRRYAEDMDLSAHMSHIGQKVVFTERLRAIISPRQAASSPREFYKYVWSCPHTYRDHGMATYLYMYPVALFVMSLYLPIRLLYKGYNPDTQRFSLAYARRSNVRSRVSPVSDLI